MKPTTGARLNGWPPDMYTEREWLWLRWSSSVSKYTSNAYLYKHTCTYANTHTYAHRHHTHTLYYTHVLMQTHTHSKYTHTDIPHAHVHTHTTTSTCKMSLVLQKCLLLVATGNSVITILKVYKHLKLNVDVRSHWNIPCSKPQRKPNTQGVKSWTSRLFTDALPSNC